MFRGITALNLDAKGRLAVPARYRELIRQQCENQLVITINPQMNCLWMYPLDIWEEIEQKLIKLPNLDQQAQRLKRLLMGHATDCELDGSGRVLVPPVLRGFSDLDKRVMLVGQGNKFEIWDEANWNAFTEQAQHEARTETGDDKPLRPEMEELHL